MPNDQHLPKTTQNPRLETINRINQMDLGEIITAQKNSIQNELNVALRARALVKDKGDADLSNKVESLIKYLTVLDNTHSVLNSYLSGLRELQARPDILQSPELDPRLKMGLEILYDSFKPLSIFLYSLYDGRSKNLLNMKEDMSLRNSNPNPSSPVNYYQASYLITTPNIYSGVNVGKKNASIQLRAKRSVNSEARASLSVYDANSVRTNDVQLRIDYSKNKRTGKMEVVLDLNFPHYEILFPHRGSDDQNHPNELEREIIKILYRELGEGRNTYHTKLLDEVSESEFEFIISRFNKNLDQGVKS